MNKSVILFSLMVILVAQGCKKSVTLSGRVYNAVSNVGVKNVSVVLKENISARNPNGNTISTTTDAEGMFQFQESLAKGRAHGVEVLGFDVKNTYFLTSPEKGLLNKKFDQNLDLPFVKLKTVVIFVEDTTKIIAGEASTSILMSHKIATKYYPGKPFELKQTSDSTISFQITGSIKMPEGWNYAKGTSLRQNGTTYNFVDSFYVDFTNSNQIWDLKY